MRGTIDRAVNMLTLTALVMFYALLAPSVSAQDTTHRVLHLSYEEQPEHMNPVVSKTFEAVRLVSNIFAGLVRNGEGLTVVPALAESWEISEDGRVYRFLLRENLRWSDGTVMMPEHIVQSYQRISAYPRNATTYDFTQALIHAERSGGRDYVVIELPIRQPDFLHILAVPSSYVVPMQLADQIDFNEAWGKDWPRELVFSGPYVPEAWEDGQITLAPNPYHYALNDVKNPGVVLHFFENADRRFFQRIADRELDMAVMRGDGQQSFIESQLAEYYAPVPIPSVEMVYMNVNHPPLDDRTLRHALALAAAGTSFEQLPGLKNFVQLHDSFIPPNLSEAFPGIAPPWRHMSEKTRLAEARALMEGLGYSAENRLSLKFTIHDSIEYRRVINLLRSRWSRIYVDIAIEIVTWPELIDKLVVSKTFEATLVNWIYDYPHPSSLLNTFTTGDPVNISGFADPVYDAWMPLINDHMDKAQEIVFINRALKHLYETVPAFPIYATNLVLLAQPTLSVGEPSFAGMFYLADIHYPDTAPAP